MSLESDLVRWLQEHLPKGPNQVVGLGDDAAVLDCHATAEIVVTTDMLTDGVDFLLEDVDVRQVGHKSLGVNLSDLAAMAARPFGAFVSLVLPKHGAQDLTPLELAIELYRGMLPLLERFSLTIAGGDTNTWEGPLGISITALGETTERGPLTRADARVGDQLLVTGQLGGSILGRHLQVEPRVEEAILLHKKYTLHAAIDISDGLALDVARLAEASGVGAVIDLDRVPLSAAASELGAQDNVPALQHALGDGEDFELVLAVPPDSSRRILEEQPLGVSLTRIGEVVGEPGLWQRQGAGEMSSLEPLGFQHATEE